MRQHAAFKAAHPGCLLFFRLGDFYEMFDTDAEVAAKAVGLTLTRRNGIPMAGVPYHAAESYIRRLVDLGHRVAVCDQLQDPKEAKGIVERGVTRVVTAGTRVDESLLDPSCANRIAAIAILAGGEAALAAAELSTGEFLVSRVPAASLADEIARVAPAEIILPEQEELAAAVRSRCAQAGLAITERPAWHFRPKEAREALQEQFGVATLQAFGLEDAGPAIAACGALLRSLRISLGGGSLAHLRPPRREDPGDRLLLDATSLRTLEVERTMRTGGEEGSLLASMRATRTPMGRRLLRDWLCAPLRSADAIRSRQDAVAALLADEELARAIREALDRVQDIPRAASRAAMGRALPRDLVALRRSIAAGDAIAQALAGHGPLDPRGRELAEPLTRLAPLAARLAHEVVEEPAAQVRDGGVIRDGVDPALDEARLLERDADAWLRQYERELVERTGIDSLRTGYNRVFGYYIEVSHANAGRVPADFARKQTLRNAERYETAALKEFESRVLTAGARALAREAAIFADLLAAVAACAADLATLAEGLAALDVLQSFAAHAQRGRWCRPEIVTEPVFEIEAGRHPVLDGLLREQFVPNDLRLGPPGATLALVTGPNMAGKSTFIRQNALIALLAHTGSWVPAAKARVGLADRILTRLGSSDELHLGQSTFMVEMVETAAILHGATASSIVILDEVGRGTGTLDGLSLAWAIAETLARRGCRALFATHYHEITALAEEEPQATNLHVAVREWNDQIVFLHRIEQGGTDRSYGIHVAKLAGVPRETVARAQRILDSLSVQQAHAAPGRPAPGDQLALFTQYLDHPALSALREARLESLSPLEAFDLLRRLQQDARSRPD